MRKTTTYLFVLFLLSAFEPVFCQLSCTDISQRITYESGSSIFNARHSIITSNAESIICGKIETGSGFILRLSHDGDPLWARKLAITNKDVSLTRIVQLENQDILLVGSAKDVLSNNFAMILIRFDPHGNIIWSRSVQYAQTFSAKDELSVHTAAQTPMGDILVGLKGSHNGTGTDNFAHITVTRLTAAGELVWSQTFVSEGIAISTNISGIFYRHGEVIVTGQAADSHAAVACAGDANLYAMNLSFNTGDANSMKSFCYREFGNTFLAPDPELFHSASELSNGNIVLSGKFQNFNPSVYHYKVILNSSLQLEESRYYAFPQGIGAVKSRLQIMADGQILICALNDLSKQVYWTAVSKDDEIMVQRKIPYQLDMPGFNKFSGFLATANEKPTLTTSYQLNNKGVIEWSTLSYAKGSSDCLGSDTSFLTTGHYALSESGWNWRTQYSNLLIGNEQPWQIENINISKNLVCKTESKCTQAELIGPDTVCASQGEVIYKLKRNPECLLKPQWTFDSTHVESARIINDTMLSVRFRSFNDNATYTFLIAKYQSCELITDTFKISLLPFATGKVNTSELCSGSLSTLVAPGHFSNYTWQDGTRESFLQINEPGKYYVELEDKCGNRATDTFIVLQPKFSIGNDTTVCAGESIALTATPGLSEYNWVVTASHIQTSPSAVNIRPDRNDTVIASAKSADNCLLTDTIVLKVLFPRPINLGKDTSLCEGSQLVLRAGTGYASYQWNTGSTTESEFVSNKGEFTVEARDVNGCVASDSITITALHQRPSGFLTEETVLCRNSYVEIQANRNFQEYHWSTGSTTRSISVASDGRYRLTVRDSYGCYGNEDLVVKLIDCANVIRFPNAFTPNGDGINETFTPKVTGKLSRFDLKIFNRCGQVVFRTTNPDIGWPGIMEGKQQPNGVYVWLCSYQFNGAEIKTQKGIVTKL